MSIFCPNCGNEILDGQKFCSVCGTPAVIPAAAPQVTQAVTEPVVEAAAEVTETVESFSEAAAAEAVETVEAVENVADAAVENVSEAAEEVTEAAADFTEAAAAEATEAVEAVEDVTEAAVAEPVVEAVAEPVAEAIPETIPEPVAEVPQKAAETPAPEPVPVPVFTQPAQPAEQNVQPAQPVYQQPQQPQQSQQPVYQQPQQPVYQQVYQQGGQTQQNYPPQPGYTQPVYGQPVYVQQIVQEAPKKKKKLGIGSRIFVFFLCIFLFIFGVASMVLYSVRNSLSKKNLNEVITETDDFTEIEIGKLMGESVDDDETLAHYILDQIPDEQKEMFPELTEENLSKLLENKEVKELASSALGDLVAYYTGESDKLEIDADKIVDTLTENSDLIEEYTGKKMEKSDFDEVRRQITDFNENELKEIADQETGDLTKALKIVRFVFSDTCMYILFGITGFFALMILLTCGRFIDSSLIHIGATAAIAGGLAFGGIKFGKEKFADALDGKLGKSTVEMLEKVLFADLDTVGLIVLCCGAALILFGIIIKIVRAAMAK